MTSPIRIDDVRFTAASAMARTTGLVGYVALTLDNRLTIDGIALRRTRAGDLTLAFPKRRDRYGIAHPVVRPVDDTARQAITFAVLESLWPAIGSPGPDRSVALAMVLRLKVDRSARPSEGR